MVDLALQVGRVGNPVSFLLLRLVLPFKQTMSAVIVRLLPVGVEVVSCAVLSPVFSTPNITLPHLHEYLGLGYDNIPHA